MHTVSIDREGDWFVITDDETGVTTQGRSMLEALLMLADALAGYEDANEDLLAMAIDVFVPDPSDRAFLAELEGETYEPAAVTDQQVERQREAALWLAKSHRMLDYSEPHWFGILLSLVFGHAHSLSVGQFRSLLKTGGWDVLEAVASGRSSVNEIAEQLDVSEEQVREAVRTLEGQDLVATTADGRLLAAQDFIGVRPYPIDDEHVIDWEADYDHTVVRDLDPDERPSSSHEGVLVERRGTGYGWYHDPARYDPGLADEAVMVREAAEAAGSNPCPRCFPKMAFAEQFDVTDLASGVSRFERTGPDEDQP